MLPPVCLETKAALYLVIPLKIISPKLLKLPQHSARLVVNSKLTLDFLVKQVNFNKTKVLINNKIIFLDRHKPIYINNQDLANKKTWLILVIQGFSKYNLSQQFAL
jgi:hypothetical protein